MPTSFLSQTHTDALCDRDFKEWHGGIAYYGFWAILIEQQDCLTQVAKARSHLQKFFLPNYHRQAHITLNACGLLDDSHFSTAMLDAQIDALKLFDLSPFSIKVAHIDSFSTAAYLAIHDTEGKLQQIHQQLSAVTCDSAPEVYVPHITLGLYRDKFNCQVVADRIKQYKAYPPISLNVKSLQFCRYKTDSVQGTIDVIHTLKLSKQRSVDRSF